MTPWSLPQFAFHLVTFLSIAFIASIFVLPFLTFSFVLSSATVGLSFASRTSFEIGLFFYDRFVILLQGQLRGMIDQLPSNQPAKQEKKVKPQQQDDELFTQQEQAAPSQTLGSTIPLQSIEESLLDST
ncbi:Osw5 [Kluyveromyces lactis]|nr:Osw5 [Kluyveromyces lactis]